MTRHRQLGQKLHTSSVATGIILRYQHASVMHLSVKSFIIATSAYALVSPVLLAQDAAAAAAAAAAEANPIPDKPKGWETSLGLTLGLAGGNSETFNVGGNFLTKKEWGNHQVKIGAEGNYGNSTTKTVENGQLVETDQTNVNNFGGSLQYNYLLTDRWYVGARGDGRHDEIAGIDYRITATANAGYYLIKKEKLTLAIEAGPGYVWEEFDGGQKNDYATLRLADNFEWKFADKSRLFQTFEFLPEISDWGNNIMNSSVGIETDIAKGLALQVVFKDYYRSEPAPYPGTNLKREKNDYQLLAGIIYRFQ